MATWPLWVRDSGRADCGLRRRGGPELPELLDPAVPAPGISKGPRLTACISGSGSEPEPPSIPCNALIGLPAGTPRFRPAPIRNLLAELARMEGRFFPV